MVARALLQVAQDAVSNAATSAGNAAEFWDQFVPQQPSPINADSAAGLIIGFICEPLARRLEEFEAVLFLPTWLCRVPGPHRVALSVHPKPPPNGGRGWNVGNGAALRPSCATNETEPVAASRSAPS